MFGAVGESSPLGGEWWLHLNNVFMYQLAEVGTRLRCRKRERKGGGEGGRRWEERESERGKEGGNRGEERGDVCTCVCQGTEKAIISYTENTVHTTTPRMTYIAE